MASVQFLTWSHHRCKQDSLAPQRQLTRLDIRLLAPHYVPCLSGQGICTSGQGVWLVKAPPPESSLTTLAPCPSLIRPYLKSLLSSSNLLLLVPLLSSSLVQGAPQALHIMSSLVQFLAAAFPISLPTKQQSQAAANRRGVEWSQTIQSGHNWEEAAAEVPALYLISCLVSLSEICCNVCD